MTLAAVMAASLTACGGSDKGTTTPAPGQNQESAAKDSGADSANLTFIRKKGRNRADQLTIYTKKPQA